MANNDNPKGFKDFSGDGKIRYWQPGAAASQTWAIGDMLALDGSRQAIIATASSGALLGVAAQAVSGTSAGDDVLVYSDPDTIFVAQCSGTYAESMTGDEVDLEGSTGIQEINEDASLKGVLRIVDILPGETVGANARLKVYINKHVLGRDIDSNDVNFGAGGIKTDTVDESTSASGVTIDSVLLKDGGILVNTDKFTVDGASGNTLIAGTLDVDGASTISELVSFDGGSGKGIKLGDSTELYFGTDGATDAYMVYDGMNDTLDVVLKDNQAEAFEVREAANSYIKCVTTNSQEAVEIGKGLKATDVFLAQGGGAHNVEGLSGNKTLTVGDAIFQKLDPGGAGRDVELPAEAASDGKFFRICNAADAAEALTVKDDSPATIATLNVNEAAWFICDGSSWIHMGIETIALS